MAMADEHRPTSTSAVSLRLREHGQAEQRDEDEGARSAARISADLPRPAQAQPAGPAARPKRHAPRWSHSPGRGSGQTLHHSARRAARRRASGPPTRRSTQNRWRSCGCRPACRAARQRSRASGRPVAASWTANCGQRVTRHRPDEGEARQVEAGHRGREGRAIVGLCRFAAQQPDRRTTTPGRPARWRARRARRANVQTPLMNGCSGPARAPSSGCGTCRADRR